MLSFDVIGEMTFTRSFGFLDAGVDIDNIMHNLDKNMLFASLRGVYAEFNSLLIRLLGSKNLFAVTTFTGNAIRERTSAPVEHKPGNAQDFLSKFLEAQQIHPESFTTNHTFSGCIQNVVAGSDTTSVTLGAVLYNLMKNPLIFTKLRDEIDEAAASGRLSNPVKFSEAQELKYLQAVIKEGFRIFPATGLPLQRVVPAGGATIAGRFFEEGTVVGINSWVAHYNTSYFGDDADVFRPERWLESPPEMLASMASMERHFMPFGLGSRTCIGKNVSLLEISKLVPQLVRNFDFRLETRAWTTFNHWFVKQAGLEVTVGFRDSDERDGMGCARAS
ncbi:cytochrome P450 [Cadophora sp. DSE1049]|nr:cytochrome P450 [Cadophora sp. DSE1049]